MVSSEGRSSITASSCTLLQRLTRCEAPEDRGEVRLGRLLTDESIGTGTAASETAKSKAD